MISSDGAASPLGVCADHRQTWPGLVEGRYHFATMTQSPDLPKITRIDRRLDARSDTLFGLSRWLESARKQLGLGAIALASYDGCLVAGAGSSQECEQLAAVAPLLPDNQNAAGQTCVALWDGRAFLCAKGRDVIDAELWGHVSRGCLRILDESAAA